SKTLNAGNMESLIECQSEAEANQCPLLVPSEIEEGLCRLTDGNKKRKKVISWPFALRRTSTNGDCPGQLDSGLKIPLFGQPLAIICEDNERLPQPIQDLLAILYRAGPSTEGIFRKAANEKARKELKEDLNKGIHVDLEGKSVHLLAVVLKDFLRNIPSKLLSADLYERWILALEKPAKQEKIEGLKEVADKLPRPNLLLLKHLLALLHRISQSAQTNRMDSSNLAICIGPNMLSPDTSNMLPLEVQKEMNDKVTVLVEFLIDNWAAVFGEDTALNFSRLEKESHQRTGSSTEHPKATQQNGFAHGSPDAEAECSPCTSETEQPEGRSTIMSRRYPTCVSAPSLPHFTNDVSTMDRRYSEPDLSFENCLEGRIRDQKLTKSEDNFPVLQRQLRLKNKALEKQVSVLPSQLSNDSLPRSFSSCSLESSFSGSEGSVFISSPLDSPTSPKKTFLNRPQSFSAKPMENSSTVSREIKKHSMSFSFANRRKTLTKTQSWGPGKSTGFPRDSFTRKGSQFSCRIVQEDRPDENKPLYQQRPRFRSADEVFREVDQRNPGRPPSYEEATKNCLFTQAPSYSLTVQTLRSTMSKEDTLPPYSCTSCAQNIAYVAQRDILSGRVSTGTHSEGENATHNVAVGINSRVSLPVTPGVYRLRAMSESCEQSNKHKYVARRCSQPIFEVDQIQYAKESYV
ncbi:T-cell activation Rho GTPase-activating protein, partial [Tinamus guttatus]